MPSAVPELFGDSFPALMKYVVPFKNGSLSAVGKGVDHVSYLYFRFDKPVDLLVYFTVEVHYLRDRPPYPVGIRSRAVAFGKRRGRRRRRKMTELLKLFEL